jgi:hypothetical protein
MSSGCERALPPDGLMEHRSWILWYYRQNRTSRAASIPRSYTLPANRKNGVRYGLQRNKWADRQERLRVGVIGSRGAADITTTGSGRRRSRLFTPTLWLSAGSGSQSLAISCNRLGGAITQRGNTERIMNLLVNRPASLEANLHSLIFH